MRASDCLKILLGLFNRNKIIKALSDQVDYLNERNKIMRRAAKDDLIASISKTKYTKNQRSLESINHEISKIKDHLKSYALSISDLEHDDIINLQEHKDYLDARRMSLESRLRRVQNNLSSRRYFRSKNMERLEEFFPNINSDRLDQIEEFHSSIAAIMRKQLRISAASIKSDLDAVQQEYESVTREIETLAPTLKDPGAVVDRISKLSRHAAYTQRENELYEKKQQAQEDQTNAKQEYEKAIFEAISDISTIINNQMSSIVETVYQGSRRSPIFQQRSLGTPSRLSKIRELAKPIQT